MVFFLRLVLLERCFSAWFVAIGILTLALAWD